MCYCELTGDGYGEGPISRNIRATTHQLVQHYRPEVVANICKIPAETIRSLTRKIATARGACPVMYTGLEYSESGVQAIRAVLTLWALSGQLDVVGGQNPDLLTKERYSFIITRTRGYQSY